jgi:Zn finger protein HypA/HybF involved in hydrogenase expression
MAENKKSAGPPKGQLGAVEVTVLSCRCRCGHEWIARERERPRVCPKCKSPNWDRQKLFERKRPL